MTDKSGVYIIKNMVNGKFYIGSAVCFYNRWMGHKSSLNRHIHKNPHLQNAWNKYGEDNFIFEILEIVEDTKSLLEREQFWLDKTEAVKKGYNIRPRAESGFGVKLSDEAKEKIRQRRLGTKHSKEARKKMSLQRKGSKNIMYGKNHTDESKEKMKYTRDGQLRSDIYSGDNNPFYGKHHTEDAKDKISKANTGRVASDEEREMRSRINSGKNNPFFGKKHSKETRKKMKDGFTEERRKEISERMKANNPNKDGSRFKKKVHMLDIETNEIIKTFESGTEAGQYCKEKGLTKAKYPSNSITDVIKGRQETAYGYKWALV